MSHSNGQQQMDAVVIQASGPPAQSLAVRSEPVPEPNPGEVLVEVHAASVNPLDIANALGLLGTPVSMIHVDRLESLGYVTRCAATDDGAGSMPSSRRPASM
jgi:NADPH:quinone reductase-like Zn-dependent oxidoreductase